MVFAVYAFDLGGDDFYVLDGAGKGGQIIEL